MIKKYLKMKKQIWRGKNLDGKIFEEDEYIDSEEVFDDSMLTSKA